VQFLGIHPEALESIARECGAGSMHFCGGYQDQPYDADNSTDLIMVARKS